MTEPKVIEVDRVAAFRVFCRDGVGALALYYDAYDRLPEGQFRDDLWDARFSRSALRTLGAEYDLIDTPGLPDWIHEDDEPEVPDASDFGEPEDRGDR